MITERDLEQAIAECQGERNPNSSTCIKLAAFYTIRNEMFGKSEPLPGYSHAAAPDGPADTHIEYNSGTDFSQAISGMDPADIWPIIDELVSALQVVQPRLYDAFMRKLPRP